MKTTTAITTVKRDVQLQEWTEQIKAQKESGMTVTAFCAQNGINIKTYYYRLRKEGLREAVLNAIAHKNYATLTPIQIRVYDDKIMIANDCVFPEDWTVENLMKPHKSRPYNPLIASTFYRAGYIESWGRGIEKIHQREQLKPL